MENDSLILKDKLDVPRFLNAHGLIGNGAEIGVFQGEFSDHLLENWIGKKLYIIDSWRHHEDQTDVLNYNIEGQLGNLRKTFRNIYKYKEKVVLIRELSIEAAIIFRDNFFDFLFLDARHDYESVTADLKVWFPKIRPGGIFIGHDFLDGTYLLSKDDLRPTIFGVKKAVTDFTESLGISFSVTEEKEYPTWYIKKYE